MWQIKYRVGFSHEKTALLWTIFIVAFSLGRLFGGKMGDILAERLPNTGRIVLSQISSALAIPSAAVLLLVLPDDPSTAFIHGLVLFVMGFLVSWNAPATNKYVSLILFFIFPLFILLKRILRITWKNGLRLS